MKHQSNEFIITKNLLRRYQMPMQKYKVRVVWIAVSRFATTAAP